MAPGLDKFDLLLEAVLSLVRVVRGQTAICLMQPATAVTAHSTLCLFLTTTKCHTWSLL